MGEASKAGEAETKRSKFILEFLFFFSLSYSHHHFYDYFGRSFNISQGFERNI
jgi:hypothetical protein